MICGRPPTACVYQHSYAVQLVAHPGAQGLDHTTCGRSTAGGVLDDPEMVEAGGHAYVVNGCTYCHGEPGVEPATFSEGLNPPPDLRAMVTDIRPEELFWVIKNGVKMTAMPSFGADNPPMRDKNIWAIVAFLKKLSSVSDENFKAWSAAPPGKYQAPGCGPGLAPGCGPGRD